MYKVFIKHHCLSFSQKTESNQQFKSGETVFEAGEKDYKSMVTQLFHEEGAECIHFLCEAVDREFERFKNCFVNIAAAGGIVQNTEGHLLFIFRLNRWDLPKGKVEVGEDIEATAIREVEEECGVDDLQLIAKKAESRHMYVLKGEVILKTTHWFKMKTRFKGKLIPQEAEDITAAKWVNPKNMQEQMESTYPAIRELLMDVE